MKTTFLGAAVVVIGILVLIKELGRGAALPEPRERP
jgi:formate-dependent nitrite reductase membrane component NrfD